MHKLSELSFYLVKPSYYRYVNFVWKDNTYLDKKLKQGYNIGFKGFTLQKISDNQVDGYSHQLKFEPISGVQTSCEHIYNAFSRYTFIISGGYQPFVLYQPLEGLTTPVKFIPKKFTEHGAQMMLNILCGRISQKNSCGAYFYSTANSFNMSPYELNVKTSEGHVENDNVNINSQYVYFQVQRQVACRTGLVNSNLNNVRIYHTSASVHLGKLQTYESLNKQGGYTVIQKKAVLAENQQYHYFTQDFEDQKNYYINDKGNKVYYVNNMGHLFTAYQIYGKDRCTVIHKEDYDYPYLTNPIGLEPEYVSCNKYLFNVKEVVIMKSSSSSSYKPSSSSTAPYSPPKNTVKTNTLNSGTVNNMIDNNINNANTGYIGQGTGQRNTTIRSQLLHF